MDNRRKKVSEKQIYVGTKTIKACRKENNGVDGYEVEYEDGYLSWSPKAVFEKAYCGNGALSFGHALQELKNGVKITILSNGLIDQYLEYKGGVIKHHYLHNPIDYHVKQSMGFDSTYSVVEW